MIIQGLGRPEVARPSYTEGQYLSAADFVAEQDYHRRARGRHETGQHTWGVVVGFDLVEVPDPTDAGLVDAFLTPGLAVDGYGRQLVSFARVPVDPALFAAFTDAAHRSVWLQFAETDAAPTPEGYADCADAAPTRRVETFRIVVDPVDVTPDIIVDGVVAQPPPAPGASIPADTAVPFQEPPLEPPLARWLIPLGALFWDGVARRFRPAGGRLTQGRRYAGAVAAEVLAPAGTLRLAPRTAAADPDAADFATVEGRVRALGRINAERELWMEGHRVRFTLTGGAEPAGKAMTLGRDTGPAGGQDRLRFTLGDAASADVSLSVGSVADEAAPDPALEVRTDGRVRVPLGPVDFGSVHRQDLEVKAGSYGLGTQEGVLYQRSPSMFAWYTGGAHADAALDPGTGPSGPGTRRLVLDAGGALDFGAVTQQMLKLWSAPGTTAYGVGVQPWTLYFRTDADFCWFRDGSHADVRGSAGPGGSLAMKLGEDSTLQVFGAGKVNGDLTVGAGGNASLVTRHVNGKAGGSDGPDHLFLNWSNGLDVFVGGGGAPSDLDVSGGLRVRGAGQSAVQSIIKVISTNLEVPNQVTGSDSAPGTWSWNWGNQLDECFQVFVVLNAWTINSSSPFSTSPGRDPNVDVIPQTVWAKVTSHTNSGASGQAYCAQSDPSKDINNMVGITVVAIGRTLP